jgi:HSP20 family molecular chaperone IbpA
VHTRSLRFPESCDMSKIDAKFKDGSLCVKIAKKPEAKTHRIQIGGGQQAQQIEAGGS